MLNMEPVADATVDAGLFPDESVAEPANLGCALNRTAIQLRELLQRIEILIDEQHEHAKATHDVDEMQRLTDADPYRWIADAKHSLQAGIMFAQRAVVQPTGF